MKVNNLFKFNLFFLLGTTVWGMNGSSQKGFSVVPESQALNTKLQKKIDADILPLLSFSGGNDALLTQSFSGMEPHVGNTTKGFKELRSLLNENSNQKLEILKYIAQRGIAVPFIGEDFLKHKEGNLKYRLEFLNLARQKGSYAGGYVLSHLFYYGLVFFFLP